MDFKEEIKTHMTLERAKRVRQMRVEEDYSFRVLARECSESWDTDWGENQIFGEDICAVAMQLLGEKPEDGWL
jgi:hypothetical protein